MPKVNLTPKTLRPYTFHGLDLQYREGVKQVNTDCPFCGRENKFSVNVDTGVWRCLVCASGSDKGGGNAYTFLRLLWGLSEKNTNGQHKDLANNRKLLYPETLLYWGVVMSPLSGEWLVPGYAPDGKMNQLYRYGKDYKTQKRALMATSEMGHQLFGVDKFDPRKSTVYITEGPWDAMALWETMRYSKFTEEGLASTGSGGASLIADANILATPGCNVFNEQWLPLFVGKRVIFMFDNDHPREANGTLPAAEPAGYAGTKRAVTILSKGEDPPTEVLFLRWGKDGYDPKLPSGHDVRDSLTEGKTTKDRIESLQKLLGLVVPIPSNWVVGRSKESRNKGSLDLECLPCETWKVLVNAWRRPLKWPESGKGLDHALACMLASIISTRAVGDQLWFKVVSPASTGKSTLCEALAVNKKRVIAKSTMTGFHSGYRESNDTSEDNSLTAKIYDKTLVTKDGDTLLQSPNLPVILSQARDIYDGTSSTHYGNKASKDYSGIRMTWILCGTSSLRQLDSSELGERFLDCVMMDGIDDDWENDVNRRIAERAKRNIGLVAGKESSSQHDPELTKAMQLTGGYIDYLCDNATELLSQIDMDDRATDRTIAYAQFVAYLRARPSTRQKESAEREMSGRLVSQFTRLALCLAAVTNKKTVDASVMDRVRSVALGTARGITLELCKHIYRLGDEGASVKFLAAWTTSTENDTKHLLRFLKKIQVVDTYLPETVKGVKEQPRWRLTPKLTRLYEECMGDDA